MDIYPASQARAFIHVLISLSYSPLGQIHTTTSDSQNLRIKDLWGHRKQDSLGVLTWSPSNCVIMIPNIICLGSHSHLITRGVRAYFYVSSLPLPTDWGAHHADVIISSSRRDFLQRVDGGSPEGISPRLYRGRAPAPGSTHRYNIIMQLIRGTNATDAVRPGRWVSVQRRKCEKILVIYIFSH